MTARYKPRGPVAVMPSAIGETYETDPSSLSTAVIDGTVAIVPVRGPLMQHANPWFDSYESIQGRVALALETRPMAVVLSISSPGGSVAGLFETAEHIRMSCARAGVPLHAYVDGIAASAAYALASACDSVTVPQTGLVGSVGVIASAVDQSKSLEAEGVRVVLVKSGARKGDLDPSQPVTNEALAALQSQVDSMARTFFEHVGAWRTMDAGAVQSMEAAVYTGAEGVAAGLADNVGSIDDLVAWIAAGEPKAAQEGNATMEEKIDAIKAALQAMIDDSEVPDAMKKKLASALEIIVEEEPSEPEDMPSEKPEEPSAIAALNAKIAALEAAASEMAAQLEAQPSAASVEASKAAAARAAVVDAAIASGRIAASSRDRWLAIAERDVDAARGALAMMPARRHRVTAPSESVSAPRIDASISGEVSDAKSDAKRLLRLVLDKDIAERASASIK